MLIDLLSGFFCLQSVSPQPMLLYVVSINQMKVLDMKIISEFRVVVNRQLIIELLVSELDVIDQRSEKEAAD